MIKSFDHFDLQIIAESGQCFRWKKVSSDPMTYEIIHKGHFLRIQKIPCTDDTATRGASFDLSCSEETFDSVWKDYFDLQTDYYAIEKSIYAFNDKHLIECFEKGAGIRILKQDLWEMIVSFMISQNNNIKRISNSIEKICNKAALPAIENQTAYRFPLPGEINESLFEDTSLGLGYRVPYLIEIYKYGRENPGWLNELEAMSFDDAYKNLLSHLGIGPKVSNCICLFGLHHTEAFPIDTHIKQLLNKYYNGHFDTDKFPDSAGIIQQYLFYYEIS